MRRLFVALLIHGAGVRGLAQNQTLPLVGDWQLNLGRTHYGPDVDRRRRETFTCSVSQGKLTCTIRSVRSNAEGLVGQFSAPLDGTVGSVTGIPGVDAVAVKRVSDTEMDATFSLKGAPSFAYRAFRSGDGRTLVIVSVDPTSRAILNSVVVYDAR